MLTTGVVFIGLGVIVSNLDESFNPYNKWLAALLGIAGASLAIGVAVS